jgi:hypothetical protein
MYIFLLLHACNLQSLWIVRKWQYPTDLYTILHTQNFRILTLLEIVHACMQQPLGFLYYIGSKQTIIFLKHCFKKNIYFGPRLLIESGTR